MKTSLRLSTLLSIALFAASAVLAADGDARGAKKTAKPSAIPANYPLTTCVVSDEKLGDMGEAFKYVHKEAGKPDRVILLCCDGCVDDFKKEPAKYLKILDDAAAGKAKAKAKAGAAHKH
ncbi:MAG: hypothetical protein HY736_22635 [Verrucomicrobia bacterium]|nr:hypothetical protein [Verrucomicrobiota bacterium]